MIDRLSCNRIFDAQDWLIFVVFLYGGNIPFVVSLCFASQRSPTVCPHCAGSISTIGLRSFLLQVSGVSSRLSFCCTSLVSGFIIHDKGGVVYSQSVQQMRRIFAPKIQKTGIHQLHQNVALNTGGVTNAAFAMVLCGQMFYCGPLSRAIFRLLFRRGEKQ